MDDKRIRHGFAQANRYAEAKYDGRSMGEGLLVATILYAEATYDDDVVIVDGINLIKGGAPVLQLMTLEVMVQIIKARWLSFTDKILFMAEITVHGWEPYVE